MQNSFAAVCCYSPNDVGISLRTSCAANQIEVGAPGPNLCADYESTRQGCEINGVCRATVDSQRIYNLPGLAGNQPTCSGTLVPFTSSCLGNAGGTTGSGNGDDEGNAGGSNVGGSIDYEQNFEETGNIEEELRYCSDLGGPFGFFVSKEACESGVVSGDNRCIYNPYLGGKLSIKYDNYEDYRLSMYENSCVPKSFIQKCMDYKTKENCLENPSKSYSSRLKDGCTWIHAGLFGSGYFDKKDGICISNSVSTTKDFDPYEYSFRGNLLKNPSFEDGDANWGSDIQVIPSSKTFHGNNYGFLVTNGKINQTVFNVASDVSYSISLYAKSSEVYTGDILVVLTPYNSSGDVIEEGINRYSLSFSEIFGEDLGYFKKVMFTTGYITPSNVSSVKIEISTGFDVAIDAIGFQPFSAEGATNTEVIYNPTEIISSKASSCDLCYDDLKLNLCTSEKSDFLGDCSYMGLFVENPYKSDLDGYLGRSENIYLNEENKWTSQSLANSLLFCELYTTQDTCENPNNYVNSKYSNLHLNSAANLCRWNGVYGCFKDSNGDNLPDVINNTPKVIRPSNPMSAYIYESTDSRPVSDFEFACDSLTPNSYFYFKARNTSGDEIIVTDSVSGIIGNVQIYALGSDLTNLESCEPFNIDNKLYLKYTVNGQSAFRTIDSNQLYENYYLIDYFEDGDGNSLIQDSLNTMEINFVDQSGNLGKTWNFDLDIDSAGPNITLANYPSHVSGDFLETTLGPESSLRFDIRDRTEITYCNYTLEPLDYENTNVEFYDGVGSFDLTEFANPTGGVYEFEIPIYNTSNNLEIYDLTVRCADLFEQETVYEIGLTVDYNTDVILVSPKPFRTYTATDGFLNSEVQLVAVSDDRNIDSCSISFPASQGFTGTTALQDEYLEDSFAVDGYSTDFYTNITGTLSFSHNGPKNATITCTDTNGNEKSKNYDFYYDTEKPELRNYEFIENIIGGVKNVYYDGSRYYSTSNNPGTLNLSFDATQTWMDNDHFVYIMNESSNIGNSPLGTNMNMILTPSPSSIDFGLLRSYGVSDIIDLGIVINENYSLYEKKYNITFFDKAGNNNSDTFSFYYDKSVPSFIFGGDIVKRVDNKIYTREYDPEINLEFNSSDYRKYTCSVSGSNGLRTFTEDFSNPSSQIVFSLSEISTYLNLEDNNPLSLNLNCTDVYGKSIRGNFNVYYDNTTPVLSDFKLNRGNKKYFNNYENIVYNDLVDKLKFHFEDTDEISYECFYQIRSPSSFYSCNESLRSINFGNNLIGLTDDLVLVSGSSNTAGSVCYRTPEFFSAQSQTIVQGREFNTDLTISGYCQDMVNLRTETKTINIDIDYVDSEILEFNYEFANGNAYPVVKTLSPFEYININLGNLDGETVLTLMNPTFEDGSYIYSSSVGFDISGYNHGEYDSYALAYDSADNMIDSKYSLLTVDHKVPMLNVHIPDELNGIVYGEEFDVSFDAYDVDTGIRKVEVFVNNNKVYSSENLSNFDSSMILSPESSYNYFGDGGYLYEGKIHFIGGHVGNTYDFKVIAYDLGGNVNETLVSVNVEAGVGLRLLDSVDAKVDFGKTQWVTSSIAPTISFKTSRVVDYCMVYPAIDDIWVNISGNSNVATEKLQGGSSDTFTFDLSELGFYDLSLVDDGYSNIKVVCLYNNTYYNYTRGLRYIDYLPDYVLSSSNGFVFNEAPFETVLMVKSVGPYKYISCNYGFDDGSMVSFDQKNDTRFEQNIDLNDLSSGIHNLNLECSDILGNVGPSKSYKFEIDKNAPLEIENLYLSSEGVDYSPEGDIIYVNPNVDSFNLNILLSKKNGVECSYLINPSGNMFSGVVSFFRNLFSIGVEDMSSSDLPYEFSSTGLSFNQETGNYLKVTCNIPSSDESVSVEYDIVKVDSSLAIGVE